MPRLKLGHQWVITSHINNGSDYSSMTNSESIILSKCSHRKQFKTSTLCQINNVCIKKNHRNKNTSYTATHHIYVFLTCLVCLDMPNHLYRSIFLSLFYKRCPIPPMYSVTSLWRIFTLTIFQAYPNYSSSNDIFAWFALSFVFFGFGIDHCNLSIPRRVALLASLYDFDSQHSLL